MRLPPRFPLCLIPLLLLCPAPQAQETCGVEVKLLLSPENTHAALTHLHARKQTTSEIFFFDTHSLDLLSEGVIVRLRRGAANDLTVKLRPPPAKKLAIPSDAHDDLKCEVDVIDGQPVTSYSIRRRHTAARLPDTGKELFNLLSAGQKQLLEEAGTLIDWNRVKRVVDIKSTTWQAQAQSKSSPLALALELWTWPTGQALEISVRAKPGTGPATYTQIQQLVQTEGLTASPVQTSKTAMVLQKVEGVTTH